MEKWWEEDEQADPVGSAAPAAAQAPVSDNWWESDAKVEAKQTLDGNALSRGLSRGADMAGQFYGSALESIGKATGIESLEESGRARAVRNRAELQASTPSMTTEDIDGVGSTASFVGEKLGETAVPMGTSIAAATAAGAAAGAVFGGVGAIPGAIIGAGAATLANLPYMFGSFRERQKDEDIANQRPIEVDEGTALLYALPASALDSVSDLFIVGKLAKPFKPLLESSSLLTRVTTNAATGATVESLTEVGQTVLERQQAGLSLTDEEAQKEYFEAAVAGGLIGGTVSGGMSVRKPKPTVESVDGVTDASQRAALNTTTTRTDPGTVAPDQAAALGATPPPAQADGQKARDLLTRLRSRPTTEPVATPAPAAQAPAAAPIVTPPPPVTPVGSPAPVLAPTEQVEIPTAQVTPESVAAPVIPAPADAPITEGTELDETLLSDTALNEGAEAAGDTLPTIPEAPETLAAQGAALVDRKNKRRAVYLPPETLGEVDSDALPMGKNVYSMKLPNGGVLFWNYSKLPWGKKDIAAAYKDGSLGQLLGLGPFNKAEVAASGGTQALAVTEITAEDVPVKDVSATEVTAPEQIAALEADKTEGSTIEVKPAVEVIAQRQASRRGKKEQAPVRTLKDIDPQEVARIEAEANAAPVAPKADEAKAVSAKRRIDITDAATRQRNIDAADEQAFLRKRAALEEETRVQKEQELATRKAEVQKKIEDNAFESAEDEATARIEANRTAESKDKGRDAKKISLAVKAGRLVEQFRAAMKARAGNRPVTGFSLVKDLESAKAVAKEMRAVLVEAKKQGITIGKHVDDTVTNAMAFLIDLRTTAVKLEKLGSIDDDATREAIIDEANGAVMDLNAYLLGNDAAGIRERRAVEGVNASAGTGELDVDAVVDENATLDQDEEIDETDPEDYELVPTETKSSPEDIVELSVGDRAVWMSDEGRAIVTVTGVTTRDGDLFYKVRSADGSIATVPADGFTLFRLQAAKQIGSDQASNEKPDAPAKEKGPVKVEVRKKRVIRRSEGMVSDDMTQLRDNLDATGLPLYDEVFTESERDSITMGAVPEEVLAQYETSLQEFAEAVDTDDFQKALVTDNKILSKLQAKVQSALARALYNSILNVVGDVRVYVLSDADFSRLAGDKAQGYYRKSKDFIVVRESVLNDANTLAHILIHEGSHAAFEHALDANPDIEAQLDVLRKIAEKHATKTGFAGSRYGFEDAHEFLSETFANPVFQEFLATVPLTIGERVKLGLRGASKGSQIRTAIGYLRDKLSDILGIKQAFADAGYKPGSSSMLEETMYVAGRLMELGPDARAKFYAARRAAAGVRPSKGNFAKGSNAAKLVERGLSEEQAANVSAIIDEEFGGTATDEELDALAGALGKPVGSQQGLTGPSPYIPPKLPGRVAKLLNWNPSKASKANKAILYASTLDFIDTSFRKYFGDKAGNALTDYVNAAFKYKKIADDVAALHDLDFADFEDLRKAKPAEAAKIQKLVAMLEATDIDISAGATNDHLKNTNARKFLQSKQALPEVKKLMASMDPETLVLVRRMAKNFTESHNDYIRAVTYTILEGLDTKLSNSDMMRIMDHVIAGKLDAQDKADVNDDAVYAMLERSEFLKKRKGSYFPAQRFGEHVVTTEIAIEDPGITSVVTKSGRTTVPIKTEITGDTVRFTFDQDIRGARGAVTKKVYDWVAKHELPLASYVVKYRDRQTGEIVNKGEMDVTKVYDTVHEVKLQNKGVHFFEDSADAYAFEAQAAKDKGAGKLLRHSTVLPKHVQSYREHLIPPGALDAVFASIDKNAKLDTMRKEQLKNAAREAITRNMAGNRYEKRLMGRQNVIGASDEVGRAAAYYGRSVGNAIAQIRSGGERADALARMRAVAGSKKDNPGEGNTVELVVNEIITREGLDMGPMNNNQLLDNLSTINSVDKLFSPANWFLNAMQVPMNSLPFIGGRFGNVKSARALLSAYQRTGAAGAAKSGLKNTRLTVTQVGKNRIDLDDVLGSIRKNVGAKYNTLFDELTSTNDITDNVGIENAAQLAGGRGMVGTALVKMDRAMRAMPNAIEAINRSVAAVATYDLAVGSGMSQADAIAYTREALRRTQFRYDETNKSRLMRSTPALRFFFTFKQYGQGQYQMLADALSRAMKDASPAERAMARKQLYTTFAMQVAVAGVFSFPAIEFIKTVAMLGAAMGLGDGWDEEVVDPLRELMRETFGMTVEEIASKGVMSKILGVDLSGRMSWADLIIGYPPKSGEKQDLLAWVGNAIAGPQGSLVYEMFFGAPQAMLEGDYAKALTMILPIKAISDTVKAGAGVADGKMDPVDAAKQVLGFKSLRQARISDETGVRIRESARKKKDVNSLIGDYLSAVSRGDVAKAAAAIRDYNKSLGEDEREISLTGLEKRRRENARAYQE